MELPPNLPPSSLTTKSTSSQAKNPALSEKLEEKAKVVTEATEHKISDLTPPPSPRKSSGVVEPSSPGFPTPLVSQPKENKVIQLVKELKKLDEKTNPESKKIDQNLQNIS